MKNKISNYAAFFLLTAFVLLVNPARAQETDIFKSAYIKTTLVKVAGWQFKNRNTKPENTWTNGAFYTGVFAAWEITKSKLLLDSMMAMGERNNWLPAGRFDHADDIAISQTYIDLYRIKKDKRMIQATIDSIQKMKQVPGNEIQKHGITWWWCDALFMAPPTLAKLAKTLKDPAYLVLCDTLFRQTYQLFIQYRRTPVCKGCVLFMGCEWKGKKESNGKKIFWSRGNGWVMGGLVKLLQEMPKNYAGRDFYITLFKQMSERLLALQQPDGLWRTSLLDPDAFPGGEGSGSGFNCYAMAWGVNQKILDKQDLSSCCEKSMGRAKYTGNGRR